MVGGKSHTVGQFHRSKWLTSASDVMGSFNFNPDEPAFYVL